jgi:hypothetical protein
MMHARPTTSEESIRSSDANDPAVATALRHPQHREVVPLPTEPESEPVHVSVRAADGHLVAGARLALVAGPSKNKLCDIDAMRFRPSAMADSTIAFASTDGNGAASLEVPFLGRYFVTIDAPRFARKVVRITRCQGVPLPDINAVVVPGTMLEGVANDASTDPVAALPVIVAPTYSLDVWPSDCACLRTTTDAEGRWSVGPLSAGIYEVFFVPEPGVIVSEARIEVPSISRIDLHVLRGATVSGRVVDSVTSNPLGGSKVRASEVRAQEDEWTLFETTCDADGHFEARTHLASCNVDKVLVESPGHAANPESVRANLPCEGLASGDRLRLDVRAQPAAMLRGKVTTPRGPLGGALVVANGCANSSATTNGDGDFSFAALGSGAWTLAVKSPSTDALIAETKIDLLEGEEAVRVIAVDTQRLDIRGIVEDEQGRPVDGATICAGDCSLRTETRSAEDGSFAIVGTRLGDEYYCELQAAAVGFEVQNDVVNELSEQPVVVHLKRLLPICGRVVTAIGAPVAFARVMGVGGVLVDQAMFIDWDSLSETVSNSDGAFELRAHAGWTIGVKAWSPSDGVACWTSLPDPICGAIKLVVPDAAPLVGRAVMEGTDQPVAGLRIATVEPFEHGNDSVVVRAVTNASGEFRIAHLPSMDKPRLRAIGDGLVERGFGPVSSPDGVVVVEMQTSHSIEGTVTLADKSLVEGALVWAVPTGGESEVARVTTKDDGRFAFRNLPNGEYEIHLSCASRRIVPAVLKAVAGTRDVEFIARPGARIAGVVKDIQGRVVRHAAVRITPKDDASPTGGEIQTDENGSFCVDCLDDGLYAVEVVAPYHARVVRESVHAGGDPLALALQEAREVCGVLLDPDNVPVAEAIIRATPFAEGTLSEEAKTNLDGSFVLRWLPVGACRLSVQLPGAPSFEPPAEIVIDSVASDVVLRCRAKAMQR